MTDKFLDFLNIVKGIFKNPGMTLNKLMEKKQWQGGLILILVTIFIVTYITTPLSLAKSSEMIKNYQLSEYISEQDLANTQNVPIIKRLMISTWVILILIITFSIASFFVYLFFGIGGAKGQYVNYFTLVINASIIGTLIPYLIETISLVTNINLSQYFNLIFYLSFLKPGNFEYIFLSQIDVFSIWYMIVLALGVAIFSKMNIKKASLIALWYFLFKSSVKAAFTYLSIRILSGA